ncbi:aminoglycoside phosphotransferase family protein [Rubrivivax benzoatilyticus]|uniref:aminoglycoside phosphotransferase family protein n=1 Tax=Rubrivivax benzoatilyticus TaxID=316997 RepID=UPI00020A41B6|nr:phosphotransferase [Rubrivivax benzoatilyticus]EGJ09247.1 aminoglycoside phosphotransferase [Rubrivivax benzoatilyticus JA2 = ATCC BAA-35]MCD0422322.1 phosphotransferase [Rubrivivax sp. JA1024]
MSDSLPTAVVAWPDEGRRLAFERWLDTIAERHRIDRATLAPASADASFRRYLRVAAGRGSLIVMDAPPPQEDVRPFVHVAGLIEAAGLNAPKVLECDAEQGFLLLTDLGRSLYLDALRDTEGRHADTLMRDALRALVQFQGHVDASTLPEYDEALLRRELALFPEWCVQREFGITWGDKEHAAWNRVCDALVASALAQPQVAVHRDWMPRNLMVAEPNPGILDFQDAVRGPITYDVASMLRDAFLSWDEAQEIDWAVRWWEQARRAGLPLGDTMGHDFGEFWRALEWMGLQRHLKVLGIFCRLKHRDGKPRYAEDLPRFFDYATRVAMRYAPLKPLLPLLQPLSGRRVETGFTF